MPRAKARVTSLALSLTGKTRLPRSTFVSVPSMDKREVTSSCVNCRTAALRNLPLRGTCRKKFSASQAFVTLQRPLPVM